MSKEVSNIDLLGENLEIIDENLRNSIYTYTNLAGNSRLVTVGKGGAQFATINEAITYANKIGYSKYKPITIFVYGGVYAEQIVLNDVHGLNIIGASPDNTVIQFNGVYPDCVIHVQGDIHFRNLRIQNLNSTAYAIHCDPLDTSVEGTVTFNNCIIQGGSSAIGYGSGQNTELRVTNCILSGNNSILYAHNSSYTRTNQSLIVTDCLFKHTTEEFVVMLDDAGYTNNDTKSPMRVIFANNTSDISGYPKVRFRKTTGLPAGWFTYLPVNDANILFGTGNNGNSGINGLNFYLGKVDVSKYITLPANPDNGGYYRVSIDVPVDANNYNATINDVTLPGVGSVTANFSVESRANRCVNIVTSDSNYAGKSMSLSLSLVTL